MNVQQMMDWKDQLEFDRMNLIRETQTLRAENERLTNAIKDLIGGYEMRLPELNKSYSMYHSQDDIAGCDRIAARVDEVQRLIDALRAIIKEED